MKYLVLNILLLAPIYCDAKFKVTILTNSKPEIHKTNLVEEKSAPSNLNLKPRIITANENNVVVNNTSQEKNVNPKESVNNEQIVRAVVEPTKAEPEERVKPKPIKNYEVKEGITLGLLIREMGDLAGVEIKVNFTEDWLKNIIFPEHKHLGNDISKAMTTLVSILNENQSLIDRNIKFDFNLQENLLEFKNV